jgi:hypothetical protein
MTIGFFDWQPFTRKYKPILIETRLKILQKPSTTSFGCKNSFASAPKDEPVLTGFVH